MTGGKISLPVTKICSNIGTYALWLGIGEKDSIIWKQYTLDEQITFVSSREKQSYVFCISENDFAGDLPPDETISPRISFVLEPKILESIVVKTVAKTITAIMPPVDNSPKAIEAT